MQVAYRANNLFDAHLARHALEDAGIPAFVVGENLLGAGGELPLFGVLRVCVPDPCLADAEAALHAAGLAIEGLAQGNPAPVADDGSGLLPA